MGDIKRLLKEAAFQITAGGSAGFIEVSIMQPLDVIKTRLQIQTKKAVVSKSDPKYYSGVWDCLTKMVKHEGAFALWKGIIPPILAETPKRAVKFFTFEQYKKILMFGAPNATPLTFALAGLGAGLTEAILVNPFEVVKVQLQANMARTGQAPSTWSITKMIVKKDGYGLKGLNKGITATMSRNGAFNMVYFGFYHSVKGYLPEYKDPWLEFGRKVAIGFTSGTLASCFNIPFDVAKSRIQGPQPVPGQIKYRGTIRVLNIIYSEEGYLALYKGLLPKVMRLGPGGAIMLVVYDYMYHYLIEVFPSE